MILAVGVSAIVLVAINAVLFSALHLREVTQAAVDEAAPLDQALTVLRRDLQCAVPPETNGVLTGDFKAGNVTSLGLSQPVAVEIFTATGALHDNEPWGDIQRVTYELKDPATPTAAGNSRPQHHAQPVKLNHAGRPGSAAVERRRKRQVFMFRRIAMV